MKESEFRASRLLKELGVPTRYQIVKLLERNPLTVGQIAAELKRSVATVSHHLHILRALDVVRYRASGQKLVYRLKTSGIPSLLATAERCVSQLEFRERETSSRR
jgi:DNA-binding transcriptional ArsR family regulator